MWALRNSGERDPTNCDASLVKPAQVNQRMWQHTQFVEVCTVSGTGCTGIELGGIHTITVTVLQCTVTLSLCLPSSRVQIGPVYSHNQNTHRTSHMFTWSAQDFEFEKLGNPFIGSNTGDFSSAIKNRARSFVTKRDHLERDHLEWDHPESSRPRTWSAPRSKITANDEQDRRIRHWRFVRPRCGHRFAPDQEGRRRLLRAGHPALPEPGAIRERALVSGHHRERGARDSCTGGLLREVQEDQLGGELRRCIGRV